MPRSSLCRYRYALGEPRRGIHAVRWLGFAWNDVAMTVVAAALFTLWVMWGDHRPSKILIMFLIVLAVFEGLAIILHRLFCVPTTIDRWLFG